MEPFELGGQAGQNVIGFADQHTGHDYDRQRWVLRAYRLDDVTPANRLQAEVDQRHREIMGRESIERGRPVRAGDHRQPLSAEQKLDDAANRGFVVDHKNGCHEACW